MVADKERVVTIREALREAMAHQDAGRIVEARQIYETVLQRGPRDAVTLHQLALIEAGEGHFPAAIRLMSEAIEAHPKFAEAYSNLGLFLLHYGQIQQAFDAFRAALTLSPRFTSAHRNLLHCLLYVPDMDADERFAEHRAFGALYEPPPDGILPSLTNNRDPNRRLRADSDASRPGIPI